MDCKHTFFIFTREAEALVSSAAVIRVVTKRFSPEDRCVTTLIKAAKETNEALERSNSFLLDGYCHIFTIAVSPQKPISVLSKKYINNNLITMSNSLAEG